MLSIQAMKSGQGAYYLDLAQEDYYLEGGEPLGQWWGQGAQALRIRGHVERHELENMLSGYSPKRAALTQNAGAEKRKPGWDLTFSAPKSVSVLWSQADANTRAAIQAAHLAAVKAALHYLETEVSFSRRGKGGHELDRAGLCVALFEHGTSRAGDPQLHTHGLVLNVGVRPDGTTGTIVSKWFYDHKMTAGAVYRMQLAHELFESLGLRVERQRTWFELVGVPQSLCESLSKRRQQIKEKLGELGVETASAAAFATLATRSAKTLVAPREQLFRQWREEGPQHDFGEAEVKALLHQALPMERTQAYERALAEAVDSLTREQAHFSEQELLRRTMEAAQGTSLDATFVRGWVNYDLKQTTQFVHLGQRNGEKHFTTPEIVLQEERLFEIADAMQKRRCRTVKDFPGENLTRLNPKQRAAVAHLTENPGGISVLSGMAGTGKTTTLRACRERWEAAGFEVIGASLSGKAAKELQRGSGIQSDTLAMLEMRMDASLNKEWKHHARQIGRAALDKWTYAPEKLQIDKKKVLVIDEAGMLGTKELARVLSAVQQQGGKVVLVGDAAQLQPITAGGPFAALAERLGCAKLTEVVRQRDELDRKVVRDLAAGDAKSALESLSARGLVSVQKTRADTIKELVTTWSRESAVRKDKSLIFCGTNEEAKEINQQCQKQQSLRGHLFTSRSLEIQGSRAYVGDRVLFSKNDRSLGVNNGDIGTVVAIHPLFQQMTVAVDGGERVTVRPKEYVLRGAEQQGECALRLGYAVTTHRGQGTTVDHAYVLAGGPMQNREISYVQMSRARAQTRVFVDEQTAGEKLQDLMKTMARSDAKYLAHDIRLREPVRNIRLHREMSG